MTDDPMQKRHGASIKTFSGRYVYPLNPETSDIVIEDVAHALSNQCRFSGHCNKFYSVAQHSVLVSEQMDSPEGKLWGLLHDASEAYLVDIPRPLKHAPGFGEGYREAEARMMKVIATRFNLGPEPMALKHWDNVLLVTEQRDLMNGDLPWYPVSPLTNRIDPWSPAFAKGMFLQMFHDLIAWAA